MSPYRVFNISLVLLASLMLVRAEAADSSSRQQVLIINSYHSGLAWTDDIRRGVDEILLDKESSIEIFAEFMDTKRMPYTEAYEQQILTFLEQKYSGQHIDVVLVSDNNAFDFILRHGSDLFPNVPIVFCGVNFFKPEMLDGHLDITGVPEEFDAKGTLSVALDNHPNTKLVYVINDDLPTGYAWYREIRNQLGDMDLDITVEYSGRLSMQELLNKVGSLPSDSLILLGAFFRDGEEVFYTPEHTSEMLSKAATAPIYAMLDFYLGSGVVGGHVISGYHQGFTAGMMIKEILEGRQVADIPVSQAGANRYIFDRIQLDRFGIDPKKLPIGSIQVNRNRAIFNESELAWIRDHPVVQIGPDPDFPPIEYIDEVGSHRGLAADFLKLLEEKVGIHFHIAKVANWNQAVDMAKSREIDIWAAASPTEARKEYMMFTRPMIEVPAVVITRHDEHSINHINHLLGKRVTTVSGYAAHDYLLENYPFIELYVAPDIRSALRMVSFGEVDAMVGNLATSTYYMKKEGITNLKVSTESGYTYEFSIAIRDDWPELHHILNKGLRLITDDERQSIIDKWVRFEAPQPPWQLTQTQIIGLLVFAAFAITLLIFVWNVNLRRRVKLRTAEIDTANDQLTRINEQLSESEEKYRIIFEASEDPMWLISNNTFILANEAAARLLGYTNAEALYKVEPWVLSPTYQPDGLPSLDKAKKMIEIAINQGYTRFEWQHKKRDGTLFPVEVSLTRIPYQGDIAVFCLWNDITERKEAEKEIERLATHDALTGLASLRLAEDRIEAAIALARRQDTKTATFFIDLDGFKAVNDTYGHDMGDEVLKVAAQRMKSIVREVDTVARIGGDEFLIILPSINQINDTRRVADELVKQINQPFIIDGIETKIGVSIGVAVYPDHGDTRDALVKSADRSMYIVKNSTKNSYHVSLDAGAATSTLN